MVCMRARACVLGLSLYFCILFSMALISQGNRARGIATHRERERERETNRQRGYCLTLIQYIVAAVWVSVFVYAVCLFLWWRMLDCDLYFRHFLIILTYLKDSKQLENIPFFT